MQIWSRLDHDNIVRLIGFSNDCGELPSFVSPWFDKGSLVDAKNFTGLSPSEKKNIVRTDFPCEAAWFDVYIQLKDTIEGVKYCVYSGTVILSCNLWRLTV